MKPKSPRTNVYIAVPYTPLDEKGCAITNRDLAWKVLAQRLLRVSYVSAYAINKGFNVFSPINHSWFLGTLGLVAEDWNIWRRVDFSFIDEWADEGWGLTLDGYKTSTGWNDEKARFKRQGKIWRCINYGEYETQIDAIAQGLI